MISINANTKISSLLKQHPGSLEAIVSISPRFTKLRNPILRKLIAARTSIANAARIGGCSVNDFYSKLQPLGFEIAKGAVVKEKVNESNPVPGFMGKIPAGKIIELDVRPIIETSKDPLKIILQKVNDLEPGFVLKIINTFKPIPLINLLRKEGFESYVDTINNAIVNTYFYKKDDKTLAFENSQKDYSNGWDEILDRFKDKLQTIDVRELKMPLPMHAILEGLEKLPTDKALFVYHKRIPVYLLPELEEQKFSYRIKQISDEEVHLLIYKN